MKKILLLTLISSFIIACGGDGGSANAVSPSGDLTSKCANPKNCTEEEIVSILKLPAEVDEMEAHSTILGVDLDKDDIRDDLKRKVGLAIFPDTESQKVFDRKAWLWTNLVKEYRKNPKDISKLNELMDEYSYIGYCYRLGVVSYPEDLHDFGDELMFGFDRSTLQVEISKFLGKKSGRVPRMSFLNEYCKSL
tara:strand:+ start:75 stop:653 length:579 start_codon:yes stop_codon:yes gene_type:complete